MSDREKILKQLARVMNQVAESEETVARNRKAVAESERDGRDTSLATKMLKSGPFDCGSYGI